MAYQKTPNEFCYETHRLRMNAILQQLIDRERVNVARFNTGHMTTIIATDGSTVRINGDLGPQDASMGWVDKYSKWTQEDPHDPQYILIRLMIDTGTVPNMDEFHGSQNDPSCYGHDFNTFDVRIKRTDVIDYFH